MLSWQPCAGMLAWPSFYAEPGASLHIFNTTQYFRSYTIFFRPDCNFNLAVTPPENQKVKWRSICSCSSILPSVTLVFGSDARFEVLPSYSTFACYTHGIPAQHQVHLSRWVLVQVIIVRGQQTYSYSSAGYTMLAESHLFHARYPILTMGNESRLGRVSRPVSLIVACHACWSLM